MTVTPVKAAIRLRMMNALSATTMPTTAKVMVLRAVSVPLLLLPEVMYRKEAIKNMMKAATPMAVTATVKTLATKHSSPWMVATPVELPSSVQTPPQAWGTWADTELGTLRKRTVRKMSWKDKNAALIFTTQLYQDIMDLPQALQMTWLVLESQSELVSLGYFSSVKKHHWKTKNLRTSLPSSQWQMRLQ